MRTQMRKNDSTLSLVLVLIAVLLACPANAADAADGYALLVQQSPPDAGSVNPGQGVHKMPVGQEVTLTATPKPGYSFLYWLGDVSKSSSTDTSIQIDSPKMVVAVYARDDYEESLPGANGSNAGGGGGGGAGGASAPRFSGSPIRSAGSVSPATGSYSAPSYSYSYPDFVTDNGEGEGNLPVPNTPEPTTIALMGLGGLALLKRRRK